MLETVTQYAETATTHTFGKIAKQGTNVSVEYTSNFAPSYNSTLELIRTYDDGTTRIGTVAGDYTITTAAADNPDDIKYTISVDTGYDSVNDANLFAVAPYNTEEYNPIRVTIKKSIDSSNASYATAETSFKLVRNSVEYDLAAQFMYTKDENGQYQVTGSAFQIEDDVFQLMQAFSFQPGDIVRIPDYSSEVIGKTTNSLPTYEITCSSDNCLQFNIVSFAAEAAPEFRFNIENIKNETIISAQQTIN